MKIFKNSLLHICTSDLTQEEINYYIESNTFKEEETEIYTYNSYYTQDLIEYITLPIYSELLEQHSISEIEDMNIYYKSDDKEDYLSDKQLREYQKEPVSAVLESLRNKQSGILECPAGGGKTNMAIWIACTLKLKTLFICDQYELLEQAYDRFVNFAGLKPNILSSDRIEDNGSFVTLSLFQSLYSNDELLNSVKDSFGLTIIDECHISSAPTYNYVLSKIQGLRLGLTATDRRKDGLHFLYRKHIGESIIRAEVEMLKCKVEWFISSVNEEGISKPQYTPFSDSNYMKMLQNIYYSKITKKILNDEKRNNFIINKIEKFINENRTILLITKSIEHIELIQQLLLTKGIKSVSIHSKNKKKENDNALNSIKNKEVKILLSVNKANKGMDIDILDTLILCFGSNNDVYWEQRVGRIQRFKEGKQHPLVLDISDKKIDMFSRMAKNRARFYQQQGFEQKLINE